MAESILIQKDTHNEIFMGSLGNLFDKTYTNKTFIDTFWARESPREADIANLQMFNIEFGKCKYSKPLLQRKINCTIVLLNYVKVSQIHGAIYQT